MKKHFLFLSFILLSVTAAKAQFGKGSFIAGGSVSGSYARVETYYDPSVPAYKSTETKFSFLPQVGYFVIDNLAVGIVASASSDRKKDKGADYTWYKQTSFTVGPFARYYYQKFFASASYSLGRYKLDEIGDGEYIDKNKLANATFGVGYVLLLNDYVGIEPSVVYSWNQAKSQSNTDYSSTDGSFMLNIGIQFYLHK